MQRLSASKTDRETRVDGGRDGWRLVRLGWCLLGWQTMRGGMTIKEQRRQSMCDISNHVTTVSLLSPHMLNARHVHAAHAWSQQSKDEMFSVWQFKMCSLLKRKQHLLSISQYNQHINIAALTSICPSLLF